MPSIGFQRILRNSDIEFSKPGIIRNLSQYLYAVFILAFVTGIRLIVDPIVGDHHPFVLYHAAVFVTTWYCGWKAGTLALGLGLVITDLLFISIRGALGPMNNEHLVGMIFYLIVGAVTIRLTQALRTGKRRSELHALRLTEEIEQHQKTQDSLQLAKGKLENQMAQQKDVLSETTFQLRHEVAGRVDAESRVSRLAALVDSSEDAITGKDLNGIFTDWNLGAEHLFGYSAQEVIGKHGSILHSSGRHDELDHVSARVQRNEDVPPYETTRKCKNGRDVPVSIRVSPIRLNGVVIGISSINRDLSQAKVLEEQLRQSQKMEAIGQLAGGIAHDFNNLLTIISGYSEMLIAKLPKTDPSYSLLQEIHRAGDRAAALTRQLLAFSRKQVLENKVVNLNDTVTTAEKMLRRLIGEDVRLTTILDPKLGHVKVDPGQMEQVIMNLAVNARDAMPQGGKLTIQTSTVELDQEYTASHPEVWPGRYTVLTVLDSGLGMDSATRDRIFEPFYTTKGPNQGTGLGLAVVHGIIKQSGGHIAVCSRIDRGTTFQIYLPELESKSEEIAIVPCNIPRGVETVLLVEDQEEVRKMAQMILENVGYTVLQACNGVQAIGLAQAHKGPLHLLISDVVMPEMGGRILAERMEATRPGIKVLFMSGYTDDAIVRHGVLDSKVSLLHKPFTPGILARKVREVLDADHSRT